MYTLCSEGEKEGEGERGEGTTQKEWPLSIEPPND